MGVRRERVILDLDNASFTTGMAQSSAEAALLGNQLDIVDTRTQAVTKSTRTSTTALKRHESTSKSAVTTLQALNRELATSDGRIQRTASSVPSLTRNTDQSSRSINQLTGRLRALAEAIVILGPGAIPIGAAAIPALTALISTGTIAAATVGSVVIAVQGMGDAFKAVQEYEADPTAANLEKVRVALEDLSPAAAQFVLESDDLINGLGRLQEAVSDRFFGNTIDELDELQHMLPSVRRLFVELADVASEVVGMGVDDFDSRSTREFFRFVKAEAQPVMTGLYEILRNVAGSWADVWMAMDPMNDDVLAGLVSATEDLRSWSDGLAETDGYADFMQYVDENGPKVADTLGAISNALLQVVEAGAPLGGPVLEALEFVADAVSTIADSQFGPRIVTGAAAFLLLNRALSMTTSLLTKTGLIAPGGAAAPGAAGASAAAAATTPIMARVNSVRTGVTGLRADLGAMSREYAGANRVQSTFLSGLSATSGAAQRTRATLAGASKVVAGATLASAAFAVASTEQGREIGLTNTAMLGLVGSMKGPWGAAIGAGVGLLIDFNAAGQRVDDTIRDWDRALEQNATNFAAHSQILAEARTDYENLARDIENPTFGSQLGSIFDVDEYSNAFAKLTSGESNVEKMEAAYRDLRAEAQANEDAVVALADAYGNDIRGPMAYQHASVEDLTATLERAAPAMDALGISFDELASMPADELEYNVERITAWTHEAETATGRTKAVADAIAALGDDAISTADSTTQLATALEDLLGPSLNAEAATDQWRQSLREMRRELNDDAGFAGYRQSAIENRQITRDYAADAIERLTALASVTTTTEKDMAAAVGATRREFIRSGIEAGISRREITRRANALGLTPKLVRTVFEAAGITKTQLQARRLREAYDVLPKSIRTVLRTDGVPKTEAEVDALVEKYKLTDQERRALIDLKDLATPKMNHILEQLRLVDGSSATTYVNTVHRTSSVAGSGQGQKDSPLHRRDGGEIYGPGGPRDDLVPVWASNGEFMMKAAAVDKYGKQLMHDINSLRFADGGEITRYGAQRAAAASRTTVRVSAPAMSLDGLAVTGTLLTPWGPAQIEGIARAAARAEMAAEDDFDHVHRRDR